MNILGVIPARGGSKRFPRKNLAILDGEPLVVRAIRIAKNSRLDRVVVSTEDAEIAEIAAPHAEIIDRDPALAQDSTWNYHVMKDAAERLPGYDYVMCLQPDVPFRTASDIDAMTDIAVGRDADYVGSYMPINQPVITIDVDGHIRTPIPHGRANLWKPTGIAEVYRVNALLSSGLYPRAFAYKPPRLSYAVDIDVPADLVIAQAVLDSQRNTVDGAFHRLVSK